jgi:hypothetical protein
MLLLFLHIKSLNWYVSVITVTDKHLKTRGQYPPLAQTPKFDHQQRRLDSTALTTKQLVSAQVKALCWRETSGDAAQGECHKVGTNESRPVSCLHILEHYPKTNEEGVLDNDIKPTWSHQLKLSGQKGRRPFACSSQQLEAIKASSHTTLVLGEK